MNQISLTCGPISAAGTFAMRVNGLTSAQLARYGNMCDFMTIEVEGGDPMLLGHVTRRDAFYCLLENAGYEIEISTSEAGQ